MNLLKIQTEVLKALVKGTTVKYAFHGNKAFITLNDHVGYLITDKDLRLDLGGADEMAPYIIMDALGVDLDVEIPLRETDIYRHSGTARKYLTSTGDEVYVDQGLLKCFERPKLYMEEGTDYIIVTEDIYETGSPIAVGLVTPVKIEEE